MMIVKKLQHLNFCNDEPANRIFRPAVTLPHFAPKFLVAREFVGGYFRSLKSVVLAVDARC